MPETEEANLRKQLEKTLADDPSSPIHHYNLGVFLWDCAEAEAAVREENEEAMRLRKAAAELFLAAAKLNTKDGAPLRFLGHYYARAGNARQAVKCYRRAVTLDPDDAESGEALCELLHLEGKEHVEVAVCEEATGKSYRALWAFRRLGYLQKHKRQVKELAETMLTPSIIQGLAAQVGSVQRDLETAMGHVSREEMTISVINEKLTTCAYTRCCPDLVTKTYGPLVDSLQCISKRNDDTLKLLKTRLILPLNGSSELLTLLENLHDRNRSASRKLSKLFFSSRIYRERFHQEVSWISNCAIELQSFSQRLFSLDAALQQQDSEMVDLSNELLPSYMHDLDFPSGGQEVAYLESKVYQWSKNCDELIERVHALCSENYNLASIVEQKLKLSEKFAQVERDLLEHSPKLEESFDVLQREIEDARVAYDPDLSLENHEESIRIFQKAMYDSEFSWRGRTFKNMDILPPVRNQGTGQCAFVATVSAVESQYKKNYANQANEFIVDLSVEHLQDIVLEYYEVNEGCKDSEKINICLEMMRLQGIATHAGYTDPKSPEDLQRYSIMDYTPEPIDDVTACDMLLNGNVIIGHFRVTTDYYRVGGEEVYTIPDDPVYLKNT